MSFPLFRFTLNNTIEGAQVISEPGGWDEAILKLQRHEEFHSLIEFYDQPLLFYGANSTEDGGYDYIKTCETQGPDVQITILIEISQDQGTSYSTVFTGLLDITSIKEVDFYKIDCGVIREDFWQKFINRKGTPANVYAATDLDGNAIAVDGPITFNLQNQIITQSFISKNQALIQLFSTGVENIVQIGTMEIITTDEIKTRNDMPTIFYMDFVDNPIFAVVFDGTYTFDIRIEVSYLSAGVYVSPDLAPTFLGFFAVKNGATIAAFGVADFTSGLVSSSVYTYTATLSLAKGDTFSFYGGISTIPAGDSYVIYGFVGASSPSPPSGATDSTYFNITADTTYPDTTCELNRLFVVCRNIISKYMGVYDCLTSSYLSGCGETYHLVKGINIRGYSLAEKPFTMSFTDFWEGANPIFNLGLGYESGKIRIEQKPYFYDATPVVNLNYVNFIERSYDAKRIFKSIEIGYAKWSAESDSGVDDPQTVHTYRTIFKTIGEEIKLLSKFYAASLGIEQTRRNQKEIGKDWRLDEDIMIIAYNHGDNTNPELVENYDSVTGILNSGARYNLRLTPAMSLVRWRSFFNGCLQNYLTSKYFFASGQGNIDMSSTLKNTDCDYAGAIGENADLDVLTNFLFIPTIYEFEHPLTYTQYSTIVANRTKAIGVSRTNSGHVPCHILNLEYQVTHGKAKFTVILGQTTPIS